MATLESMAMRINQALDEIEAAIELIKGEPIEALPRSQRDRDMLRVQQFEAIAKWLTELAEASPVQKDVAQMFEASMAKQTSPIKGKPRK